MHRDRRPDLNCKRRPFTWFCFVQFLKVFCLVPACIVPRGMEVTAYPSALARDCIAWEFGGIAASPLALKLAVRRRLTPPSAAHPSPPFVGRSTPPSAARKSCPPPSAAYPSPPGAHVTSPPPVHPLTQARRPAADSSTPARR